MTKETAATQYVTVTLIAKTCRECSIAFGVPDYFDRQKLRDGTTFHCPNGHGSVYRDTDETRLRRELGEAQAAAKAERERAERLDRQLVANKGQLTKMRKRATAGVCPVADCHRHFTNLERHMGIKHPGFQAQDIA